MARSTGRRPRPARWQVSFVRHGVALPGLAVFGLAVLGSILTAAVPSAHAEPVTLQSDGRTLNGNLEVAAPDGLAGGAILLLHGTLAHHDMEIIATLQALLAERGINSLGITLSLGVDRRRGMYDCATTHRHRFDDAVDEVALWHAWLVRQGAGRIGLLGHSRGGAQIARFLQTTPGAAVDLAVLIAPATHSPAAVAADYQRANGVALAAVVERARARVAAGEPDAVLDAGILYCRNARASAASLLSYYDAPAETRDTPTIAAGLGTRLLLIAGSEDTVVADLAERAEALAAGHDTIRFEMIDGADHFFRDLYADDIADLIEEEWAR